MWITPRDLEILARVHAARACDSATLADLFPTVQALRHRLWRLTRARFLKVHRVGIQRAYSLGPCGVQALGLPSREVRISRAGAARHLSYAWIRRQLQAEGYVLNGQDQVGRATLLRASRGGRRIAVTACPPGSSARAVHRVLVRLRRLVNPFDPIVDELTIFVPACAIGANRRMPIVYQGRVTFRSLPSGFMGLADARVRVLSALAGTGP